MLKKQCTQLIRNVKCIFVQITHSFNECSFKVHVLIVKYTSILAPSKVSYFIVGKALYVAVIKGYASWWRCGRVVEGAPLLRECTLTRTEGSNPFVSARIISPHIRFIYKAFMGVSTRITTYAYHQ